jgi:hypothetical protein
VPGKILQSAAAGWQNSICYHYPAFWFPHKNIFLSGLFFTRSFPPDSVSGRATYLPSKQVAR